MYSPELMKFLLTYNQEEQKSSKKVYSFKDGNGTKKLAPVTITIKTR